LTCKELRAWRWVATAAGREGRAVEKLYDRSGGGGLRTAKGFTRMTIRQPLKKSTLAAEIFNGAVHLPAIIGLNDPEQSSRVDMEEIYPGDDSWFARAHVAHVDGPTPIVGTIEHPRAKRRHALDAVTASGEVAGGDDSAQAGSGN
jgi:hypothetical protein